MSSEFDVQPSDSSTAAGMINSPELSPQGKRKVRAIKDASQARNVTRALIQYSQQRLIVNARIAAKLNAEKPFQQHLLEAEGLGNPILRPNRLPKWPKK
jgi:hypothetical protein